MKQLLMGWIALASMFVCLHVQADDLLSVGSVAPALEVEHWLPLADGKNEKVTKFEAGKIYVVEFWATWCGPCVQGMRIWHSCNASMVRRACRSLVSAAKTLATVKRFLDSRSPAAHAACLQMRKTKRRSDKLTLN